MVFMVKIIFVHKAVQRIMSIFILEVDIGTSFQVTNQHNMEGVGLQHSIRALVSLKPGGGASLQSHIFAFKSKLIFSLKKSDSISF